MKIKKHTNKLHTNVFSSALLLFRRLIFSYFRVWWMEDRGRSRKWWIIVVVIWEGEAVLSYNVILITYKLQIDMEKSNYCLVDEDDDDLFVKNICERQLHCKYLLYLVKRWPISFLNCIFVSYLRYLIQTK